MEQSEKTLLEFAGYCYIHKPELANDLNTLIANFINKPKEQLSIPRVSNRYFVFSGQEDNKPTKYLVDDCKDRETAIAKIETEYPNFKWVMTETFNGC